MIRTEKVIDTYTDLFGNEVDVYEEVEKYTVWYEGAIFAEDSEGLNTHNYDCWEDAFALYHAYGDMIHISDNEYDITYEYGEWN